MRRTLPINLHYDGDPRERTFCHGNLRNFIHQNRNKLISEIAGMVIKWKDEGCPYPTNPATHSISTDWARTVDAILKTNGYDGFLSNFGSSEIEYLVEDDSMTKVFNSFCDVGHLTPVEWVSKLKDHEILSKLYKKPDGSLKNERSASTSLGIYFKKFENKPFNKNDGLNYKFTREESGPIKTYGFIKTVDIPIHWANLN